MPLPVSAVQVYSTASGDPYATAAFNGAGWNYVGANASSGVYLGHYSNGYFVLTANHVGLGNFMLNGTTYTAIAGQQAAPGVDLYLYSIAGDSSLDSLSNLVLGAPTVTADSSLNMIGFGGGSKRGGYNTPEFVIAGDTNDIGYTQDALYTVYDPNNPIEGEAQAIGGDSGGGVFFYDGNSIELAAIMVTAGTINSGSSSEAKTTGAVWIQSYATNIQAIIGTAVPEPSAMALCVTWVVLAVYRRAR